MKIGRDTVIMRGSEHVEAEMAGQTVMMSIAQGKYFALEGTARRIWELLVEPASVGQIVEWLVEEYEVDRERCAAEVEVFVRQLIENGLVVEQTA